MTRLYLVRHGRAAGGWDDDPDPSLDELGRLQASRLAARLASLGPMPVWSSPLRRCRETAAELASRWGAEVLIQPAVTEIPSPDGVPMGRRVAWLRDAIRRMVEQARAAGSAMPGDEGDFDPDGPADDGNPMGTAEHEITLAVDVRDYTDRKRAALLAHRSQVSDTSFFADMPDDMFRLAFGTEWFIEKGVEPGAGPRLGWLFE